ncbi:hypothetical protein LSCM1_05013 [Leishmania martiniquensis]|uniref:Uncharacterized protein n=1 Tax=Leishmania martiniquensis TaxID=1580590 RepID=A0A836G991_9TRYP|nr:hypothetical protein LSCM1_05013 [Leishmania martiniquensis]
MLRLDLGSNEVVPPERSDSTVHTPIALCPPRPSSLYREKTPTGSAQATQGTSGNRRLAGSAAQCDTNTEPDGPVHLGQAPAGTLPMVNAK